VLISLWSVKGGAGTTVVAVSLSLILDRANKSGALIVDLDGDVPAALGLPDPGDPGVSGWLSAGSDVPADALARLEVPVGRGGVSLLPRGNGALTAPDRAEALAAILAADPRPVVVDCGTVSSSPVSAAFAAAATHSLLVTRACYLSLRRAATAPVRPTGVVLVNEPGRSLSRADVEQVVGAPIRAEVAVDPAVARAVDAGVLASRLPRTLERSLRYAA
jgi:MinD-like ATPase involved in chromosome partitioning or flagellar assembly